MKTIKPAKRSVSGQNLNIVVVQYSITPIAIMRENLASWNTETLRTCKPFKPNIPLPTLSVREAASKSPDQAGKIGSVSS